MSCDSVLWLFLTVPWVGLQFEIVVFPDHAHFFFTKTKQKLPCDAFYVFLLI